MFDAALHQNAACGVIADDRTRLGGLLAR